MIFYKEEKKKLVIPSGFVMIPIDCDEAIEQAREDGYREGFADGSSATCDTEEGTYSLTDNFDGEETVFPSEGKTGFNKIVIVDDGYGDKKYNEGYADGIGECSGSTCNIQPLKSVMPQFDNYPVDYQMDIYPDEGYDGLGRVSIDKRPLYQQGYEAGLADCPQCSGETPCDCSSAITEAYESGYTAGLEACSGGTCPTETGLINLDSGWSGYESYQPLGSGYFDQVIITDDGYGQAKFDQGYELGLATCSASSGSCLIEDEQTVSLNNDWTGFTIVYPSQGYDGLGRVLVADLGYGQAKYDQGYADGRTSGYTEGYNAAITANCGSAITEAYESGATEERGNIYAVKIKVTPTSPNWSWTQFGTPHKLTAADALGNNYVFNINYVIYDGYSWDEDAGQTHIDYEFLGRFETTGGTPVKYLTPAQLTIEVPSQDYNDWGSNIGIEVFFNGEMIPAQYEGETLPPYAFDLENGFKYATTSYSVGYNAVDSRCVQLIINL